IPAPEGPGCLRAAPRRALSAPAAAAANGSAQPSLPIPPAATPAPLPLAACRRPRRAFRSSAPALRRGPPVVSRGPAERGKRACWSLPVFQARSCLSRTERTMFSNLTNIKDKLNSSLQNLNENVISAATAVRSASSSQASLDQVSGGGGSPQSRPPASKTPSVVSLMSPLESPVGSPRRSSKVPAPPSRTDAGGEEAGPDDQQRQQHQLPSDARDKADKLARLQAKYRGAARSGTLPGFGGQRVQFCGLPISVLLCGRRLLIGRVALSQNWGWLTNRCSGWTGGRAVAGGSLAEYEYEEPDLSCALGPSKLSAEEIKRLTATEDGTFLGSECSPGITATGFAEQRTSKLSARKPVAQQTQEVLPSKGNDLVKFSDSENEDPLGATPRANRRPQRRFSVPSTGLPPPPRLPSAQSNTAAARDDQQLAVLETDFREAQDAERSLQHVAQLLAENKLLREDVTRLEEQAQTLRADARRHARDSPSDTASDGPVKLQPGVSELNARNEKMESEFEEPSAPRKEAASAILDSEEELKNVRCELDGAKERIRQLEMERREHSKDLSDSSGPFAVESESAADRASAAEEKAAEMAAKLEEASRKMEELTLTCTEFEAKTLKLNDELSAARKTIVDMEADASAGQATDRSVTQKSISSHANGPEGGSDGEAASAPAGARGEEIEVLALESEKAEAAARNDERLRNELQADIERLLSEVKTNKDERSKYESLVAELESKIQRAELERDAAREKAKECEEKVLSTIRQQRSDDDATQAAETDLTTAAEELRDSMDLLSKCEQEVDALQTGEEGLQKTREAEADGGEGASTIPGASGWNEDELKERGDTKAKLDETPKRLKELEQVLEEERQQMSAAVAEAEERAAKLLQELEQSRERQTIAELRSEELEREVAAANEELRERKARSADAEETMRTVMANCAAMTAQKDEVEAELQRAKQEVAGMREQHQKAEEYLARKLHQARVQCSNTAEELAENKAIAQKAQEAEANHRQAAEKANGEVRRMRGFCDEHAEASRKLRDHLATREQEMATIRADLAQKIELVEQLRSQQAEDDETKNKSTSLLKASLAQQAAMEKERDAALAEVPNLRRAMAESEAAQAALKEQLVAQEAKFKEGLLARDEKVREIRKRFKEAQAGMQQAVRERAELSETLALRQADMDSLRQEVEEVRYREAESKRAATETAERAGVMEEELQTSKALFERVAKQADELRAKLTEAERAGAGHLARCREAESRLADLDSQSSGRLASFEARLADARRDAEEAESRRAAAVADSERVRAELEELRAARESALRIEEDMGARIAELEKEISGLREESVSGSELPLSGRVASGASFKELEKAVAQRKAEHDKGLEETRVREAHLRTMNKSLKDEIRKLQKQQSAGSVQAPSTPLATRSPPSSQGTGVTSPTGSVSSLRSAAQKQASGDGPSGVSLEYLRNIITKFVELKDQRSRVCVTFPIPRPSSRAPPAAAIGGGPRHRAPDVAGGGAADPAETIKWSRPSHSFSQFFQKVGRLREMRLPLWRPQAGRNDGIKLRVHAAVRPHRPAHLADLQREGRVLERLLHLAAAEVAEVAARLRRPAVRLAPSDVGEVRGPGADLVFERPDEAESLLLRPRYDTHQTTVDIEVAHGSHIQSSGAGRVMLTQSHGHGLVLEDALQVLSFSTSLFSTARACDHNATLLFDANAVEIRNATPFKLITTGSRLETFITWMPLPLPAPGITREQHSQPRMIGIATWC
ncbi:MAG: hypothetical protein BJ554DRAFT_1511, partial [Olpidium bornovanus]